jgi:hypothetical protein
MKTRFLSILLTAASIGAAHAQFGYTFTAQSGQTYTPLTTGATTISAGVVWDDDTFSAPVPFTFQLDRRPLTTLRVTNDGALTVFGRRSTNGDTSTAFVPMDGDLRDRGTMTPRSPIRYAVTGTAPSRIFKLEYFNAGFFEDSLNTDSVNFQLWLYETSNVVELRYGSSRLTPANLSTYFTLASGGPFVGFFKNIDFNSGTFGKLYHLTGLSTAPSVDSVVLPTLPSSGLSGYPANGTVYRFTPTNNGGSTSVSEALTAARALKLYPTAATEAVTVEWSGTDGETYQILSSTGAMVGVGRLQRGEQNIAVNWLPVGTYTLRVAGGGHVFLKR